MSKFKSIIIPAVSLFVICLVSVLLLAVTNELTKDEIEKKSKETEAKARNEVVQNAESFDENEIDGRKYAVAKDKDGNILGYIFVTTGRGYGGNIEVMTAVKDGIIIGIKVLDCSGETATVGQKAIKEKGLAEKYIGTSEESYTVNKNIDGVSGATVTSKGVSKAVNDAMSIYKSIINSERGAE